MRRRARERSRTKAMNSASRVAATGAPLLPVWLAYRQATDRYARECHSPAGQDTPEAGFVPPPPSELSGRGPVPTILPATCAKQRSAPRPLALRDTAPGRAWLRCCALPPPVSMTSTRVVVNVKVAVMSLPLSLAQARWTLVTDGAAGGGGGLVGAGAGAVVCGAGTGTGAGRIAGVAFCDRQ